MSQLVAIPTQYWKIIQGSLFSRLQEKLDFLTKNQQQLIEILELVRIEEFLPNHFRCEGRPQKHALQLQDLLSQKCSTTSTPQHF